jgi:CPA2 family monovalent cation:H+ antiporter-2
MTVLVRTRDDADLEKLQSAGATEVIPELIEGSLMLASHVLLMMGVPMRKVVRRVTDAREERYGLLRGYFRGTEDDDVSANQSWHLHSVPLQENAKALGKRLSELSLEEDGAHIQAVRRKQAGSDYLKLDLSEDPILQMGDIVVLSGSPESIDLAETRLL